MSLNNCILCKFYVTVLQFPDPVPLQERRGFVPVRCVVAVGGWSSGRALPPRNSAWLATARVRPGPPPQSCHDGGTTVRSEIALSYQQFGVEDGCASGAADGIVAQHDEAVPQHAVRGDAAYRDAHAAPGVPVERSEERRVGKECRSRWSP